jgi:hypothetical protein
LPVSIFAAPARSFMTEKAVTLFPEPDSPTTPRVCPSWIESVMPSTAFTTPSSVWK